MKSAIDRLAARRKEVYKQSREVLAMSDDDFSADYAEQTLFALRSLKLYSHPGQLRTIIRFENKIRARLLVCV